jgi:hypothetical protein
MGNMTDGVRVSDANGTDIGGTEENERNVISGNGGRGVVLLLGATGSDIQGNYIGTNISGAVPMGNVEEGIRIFEAAGNTIGGSNNGARNVISANGGDGVAIDTETSSGNRILGNHIGVDVSGAVSMGNAMAGVRITDAVGNGVGGTNPGDTDLGPNRLQNFPVLTQATSFIGNLTVTGNLNAAPQTTYRLEFFANKFCDPTGHGEGRFRIGATDVLTNASGDGFFFNLALPPVAPGTEGVTVTATDPVGNTSEFSECKFAGCGDLQVFGQTVIAASTDELVWNTPADVLQATGDLANVSTYGGVSILPQDQVTSFDISAVPAPGTGNFFVMRLRGCGSWETSPGAEPGRDPALP